MTEENTNNDTVNDSTELIQVKVSDPTYQMNDRFVQLSQDIPLLVERAHQLLDQIDEDNLENMDEDEVLSIIKDMREVKPFYKQVKDARDNVQRYLKAAVKTQMTELDKQLANTGVAELEALIAKTSDLQKRIQNDRKERRWSEIKTKFEQTINQYPLLKEHVPFQISFDKFREANPKLVSTAKNANITSSTFNAITVYIGNLESDVQSILSFQSPFQEQLFSQYQLSPNLPQIVALNRSLEKKKAAEDAALKAKQDAEVERLANERARKIVEQEAEERRKREAKAIKEAQDAAAKDSSAKNGKTTVIVKTIERSSLSKSQLDISSESRQDLAGSPFSETLESYLKAKYPSLDSDAKRFDAIFKTVGAIGHQDPELMRFIKSPTHALDAIKLLLMAEK